MKSKLLPLAGLLTISCIAWLMRPLPEQDVSSCCAVPDAPMWGMQKPARARPVLLAGVKAYPLPATAEDHWKKTSPHAPMAAFQAWAADFIAKPDAVKIADGVKAVMARRVEMKRLIEADPEAALAAAVPLAVRRKLPPEVQALLEERIDARGDFLTVAVSYGEEAAVVADSLVRTQVRLADGRKLRAHTYGRREYQPTRFGVPVHGIAMEGHLAVLDLPGRVMEPIELLEAKATLAQDPLCPVSELPTASTGTETGLLIASEAEIYCSPEHAEAELYAGADAEAARSAAPRAAASGSDAATEAASPFRAPLNWTTGQKRILAARINFPANDDDESAEGVSYHQLSAGNCTEILTRLDTQFNNWSYGRLRVKPVGSGGSGVTPMLRMDAPASAYVRSDFDDIVNTVWDLASDHGYHEENYDLLLILAGNAPLVDDVKNPDNPTTATWSGLGMIGASGSLIRVYDPAWTLDERLWANVNVALHELGHNFGLLHSSSLYRLPAGSKYSFGKLEYGDPYDTMGKGLDYNARYKHWLRWLDNDNMRVINGSGVHTIRESDLADKSGTRGLQIKVGTTEQRTDVFVEYRISGLLPENTMPFVQWNQQLMAHGAMIRLGRSFAPKTFLMDSTEETPGDEGGDGVADSPLLPGRTYRTSQPNGENLWITNLNADPVAGELTVDVRYGTPAGNRTPTAAISTVNGDSAGVNSPLLLTCAASDPDGDALSYHWIIAAADEDARPWNRAVFPSTSQVMMSFADQGKKLIKCIVSDRHGGEVVSVLDLNVIENEAPSVSAVPDLSMDEDGMLIVPFTVSDTSTPAELITASAFSDDGVLLPAAGLFISGTGASRTLRITPGANRFGKAEIVISANDGDRSGAETFMLTVRPQAPGLIASAFRAAGWRYSATGTSPSNRWRESDYDDSAWAVDNAAFANPIDVPNVLDTTDLGNVPGRLTCYFRRQFSVPAILSGVPMVRLMCDDGAVVYINGVEAFRHNMPGGVISPDTLALESVEGDREKQIHIIPVDPALIIPGQVNTIAVEVHDAANVRGANDVLFDLDIAFRQPPTLSAIANTQSQEDTGFGQGTFTAFDSEPGGGTLTFTWVTSDPVNLPPLSITTKQQPDGTGSFNFPSPQNPGVIQVTMRVSDGLSETWRTFTHTTTPKDDPPQLGDMPDQTAALGQTPVLIKLPLTDPDTPLASIPISFSSTNATLLQSSRIKTLAGDETTPLWMAVQPEPGVTGETHIDISVSYPGGSFSRSCKLKVVPAVANAVATPATLVPKESQWLMWAASLPGGDKPIDFTAMNLDDSTWTTVTTPAEAAIPAAPSRVTTYFRRSFEAGGASGLANLALRLRCDDGAAVYLNGALVAHYHLPVGPLQAATLATKEASEVEEATWLDFDLSPALLVAGRNVIAVEIHQSHLPNAETSGDPLFDLELLAMPAPDSSSLPTSNLIAPGSSWAYWDYPVDDAADALASRDWTKDAYETGSVWKTGSAPLGYGTGLQVTTLNRFQDSAGGDTLTTIPSALFRRTFHVSDPAAIRVLHLLLQRDDGATVYLNGERVLLDNLAQHDNLPTARALGPATVETRSQWRRTSISTSRLRAGINTLAISIHQHPSTEDTLHFDLQLIAQLNSHVPKPQLRVEAGAINLDWSSAYLGWQLQKSSDLVNWSNVGTPLTLDGATLRYQEAIQGTNCFYRLVQP